MEQIEALISEGYNLKLKIDSATVRLRAINKMLSDAAEYKEGSKTGHLLGSGIKVKVQLKENEKWHQDRLLQLRDVMGDEFTQIFEPEYKPKSSKVLKAYMEFGNHDFRQGIEWAREVKPGSPAVSYEPLEGPNA